jgi:hypothetical protein
MAQGEGGGRPTKYKAAYCKQAKALSKLGATDFEMAQFFEITTDTLNRWKIEHPRFSASIKLGKAPSDKRIEQSLYHRARGYSFESEEIFMVETIEERPDPADPKAPPTIIRRKEAVRVPIVKHVPPDPTAMIFWLKNRRKDRWRDFKATELSTPPGRPLATTYTPSEPVLLESYHAKLTQSNAAAVVSHPAAAESLGRHGRQGDEEGDDPDLMPPR